MKLKRDKHSFLLEVQGLRAALQEQPGGAELNEATNEIQQLRAQLQQERQNYMFQFRQMEDQVRHANSGSKGLESKMKRLYSELNNRMNDQ